jgi:predicted amidohydrolase YtcJ
LADLVVLETDLSDVKPEELGTVQVDMTIREGEIVYQR